MNQLPVTIISENCPQRALRVTPNSKLDELWGLLLTEEAPNAVFLLDERGGLAGILNFKELLAWGWLYLGHLSRLFAMFERKLMRLARAQTAVDWRMLNSQEMAISQQATVAEGVDTLLVSNLDVAASVDENGRAVNDLHLEDLLAYTIRQSKENEHG